MDELTIGNLVITGSIYLIIGAALTVLLAGANISRGRRIRKEDAVALVAIWFFWPVSLAFFIFAHINDAIVAFTETRRKARAAEERIRRIAREQRESRR